MGDKIIIISGAARSGTSLVAGAINKCGAFGGNMSPGNRNNEKGMFENSVIRNNILKPYLRSLGADALGQFPLPDVTSLPIPADWKKRVEDVFIAQGYNGNQRIFYKGAKACLTWPVWNYAFPNAKWIIVRRRTGDIVNSCLKTSFMRAFKSPKFQKAVGVTNEKDGWIWWVRQHEKRFVEMINQGLNCKIIWPDRMVNGDYSQIMEVIEWLGLEWNSEVLSFIDPKLWHSRNVDGKSKPMSVVQKLHKPPRTKSINRKLEHVKPTRVIKSAKSELFNPIKFPSVEIA